MKRIVGLLGWLGVVLVLAAVLLRFQGYKGEWQQYSQPLALAGLVVTALYAVSQWRDIGRSFQGRNVRYGSIAAGTVVLFLGILVAVNWISNRQHKRWDLTANKQFSLSDQTRRVLTELQKPLAIKAFYEGGPSGSLQGLRDQLEEYQYASKQVSVEYVDAVKDPIRARSYQVQTYGTVVLEYDGRTERAAQADEQTLTNALKKLIEGQAKKIYFVTGHGEHDSADTDRRRGYSVFAEALKSDNFEVANVALAQEGKVPDDATVLVIAGPQTDFFVPELDAVRAVLKKGGKMLLLLDPSDKVDSTPIPNLLAFAKEWGIAVGNDIVVDASGVGRMINAGPEVPIAMPVEPGHAITRDFRLMTAFPVTRSVAPIEGGTDGKVAQKLLQTSPQSWAETDLRGLITTRQPKLDDADTRGPVSMAAAVSAPAPDAPAPASAELPKPESRVVVVGDSDFASNSAIGIQGNRDLALNITNWLAQQENLIAIRPKDPQDRKIQLTEDQSQRIFWLALLVIPGLLIGTGVRVWWKRR